MAFLPAVFRPPLLFQFLHISLIQERSVGESVDALNPIAVSKANSQLHDSLDTQLGSICEKRRAST